MRDNPPQLNTLTSNLQSMVEEKYENIDEKLGYRKNRENQINFHNNQCALSILAKYLTRSGGKMC